MFIRTIFLLSLLLALGACSTAEPNLVPRSYGMLGESTLMYRPMPDNPTGDPQAFVERYNQSLASCRQMIAAHGPQVAPEAMAGMLKGGLAGAAGGAASLAPYTVVAKVIGLGAGENGIFGATSGIMNGTDYGVTLEKGAINQCMFDRHVTVIPTTASNWSWAEVFGQSGYHPVGQAPQENYIPSTPRPSAPMPLYQQRSQIPSNPDDLPGMQQGCVESGFSC